ncbi:MAG: hypothetical protein IAE81_13680 [Caldilineaceae bacterium]|jgi:predicted nucleic acid-binding protein|nr:hypothetical protein [Caldilineaceae bacterium]
MKAVSNAGPLIALGKLGLIPLLHQLYRPLLVSKDVHQEVVERGLELGQPDAYVVQIAVTRRELTVVTIDAEELLSESETSLHRGERAAIWLARRERADWVLLDDEVARRQALALGLHVKGTLGIIVDAHRRSLLHTDQVEWIFQLLLDRADLPSGTFLTS